MAQVALRRDLEGYNAIVDEYNKKANRYTSQAKKYNVGVESYNTNLKAYQDSWIKNPVKFGGYEYYYVGTPGDRTQAWGAVNVSRQSTWGRSREENARDTNPLVISRSDPNYNLVPNPFGFLGNKRGPLFMVQRGKDGVFAQNPGEFNLKPPDPSTQPKPMTEEAPRVTISQGNRFAGKYGWADAERGGLVDDARRNR
jgi:hypothetical protein